jgi:hypothetical protein
MPACFLDSSKHVKGLSQNPGFTVPKCLKDWPKRWYLGGLEVFETGMWFVKPNKYGLKPGVSGKMWYVPHFKHRIMEKQP